MFKIECIFLFFFIFFIFFVFCVLLFFWCQIDILFFFAFFGGHNPCVQESWPFLFCFDSTQFPIIVLTFVIINQYPLMCCVSASGCVVFQSESE